MLKYRQLFYVLLLILSILAPWFFYPIFLMKILCFALFASAFNLLLGYTGLLSFGHAAFFGGGGYLCGYIIRDLGQSPEFGILGGTLFATLLGVVMSTTSTRGACIRFSASQAVSLAATLTSTDANPPPGGEHGPLGLALAVAATDGRPRPRRCRRQLPSPGQPLCPNTAPAQRGPGGRSPCADRGPQLPLGPSGLAGVGPAAARGQHRAVGGGARPPGRPLVFSATLPGLHHSPAAIRLGWRGSRRQGHRAGAGGPAAKAHSAGGKRPADRAAQWLARRRGQPRSGAGCAARGDRSLAATTPTFG